MPICRNSVTYALLVLFLIDTYFIWFQFSKHLLVNTFDISLLSISIPLYLQGLLSLQPFFYSNFTIIFLVGLHAYFSNHCPFLREHIFTGYNEFPSLVCWCTVIHHHRPQEPLLFRRERWDFTCVQSYVCRHGTSCLESHPRRLGNVQ